MIAELWRLEPRVQSFQASLEYYDESVKIRKFEGSQGAESSLK